MQSENPPYCILLKVLDLDNSNAIVTRKLRANDRDTRFATHAAFILYIINKLNVVVCLL